MMSNFILSIRNIIIIVVQARRYYCSYSHYIIYIYASVNLQVILETINARTDVPSLHTIYFTIGTCGIYDFIEKRIHLFLNLRRALIH
jgi:hypothetical protein